MKGQGTRVLRKLRKKRKVLSLFPASGSPIYQLPALGSSHIAPPKQKLERPVFSANSAVPSFLMGNRHLANYLNYQTVGKLNSFVLRTKKIEMIFDGNNKKHSNNKTSKTILKWRSSM